MINQNKFFEGLDFEKCEFEYELGKKECYKGSDGGYYRVDHFGSSYVIEYSENEDEAKLNYFEDADLYDDRIPEAELIAMIQKDLNEYVLQ